MPLWHMINVKLEFRLRQARLLLAVLLLRYMACRVGDCWAQLGLLEADEQNMNIQKGVAWV